MAITLLKFEEAQEAELYLAKAYDFYNRQNDLKRIADAAIARGIAFNGMKEYDRAIDCFHQAKSILDVLDLKSLSALVEHTIASEITVHQDPQLAIQQLQHCLTLLSEEHFDRIILTFTKMADIHLSSNDPQSAHNCLQEARRYIEKHSFCNTFQTGHFYRTLAQYHYNCETYDKCLELAFKSADTFARMNLGKDQVKSLQLAISACQQLGDVEQALQVSIQCNTILLK